jgi:hypothetical protein
MLESKCCSRRSKPSVFKEGERDWKRERIKKRRRRRGRSEKRKEKRKRKGRIEKRENAKRWRFEQKSRIIIKFKQG